MGASTKESDRTVSGLGIIDRVIASGSEPVFRADGYTFRVSAATEVRFREGLKALSEVGTNTLAKFDGERNSSGEVVATKVEFARLKLPKHKNEPTDLQVTTFPPGSKIDAYKGFGTAATNFPEEDQGGWCGWYPVPPDAALQERIRQIGMRVVPKYQRDLPVDDRAKIPFRFYVVEGTYRRTAIFCDHGLVLVPVIAVERLPSDDLLAAVLAEGVAGVLQQQAEDGRPYTLIDAAKLAAGAAGPIPFAAVGTGGLIEQLRTGRSMEHARGRMALALMADAGYDPHQAPEAWRLLAPERLPKDLAKLKDPERSLYLLNFLKVQYNPAAVPSISAPQAKDKATATPGSPDAAPRP
ncbi:MAG TPA: hypothetical protein VN776_04585 [Terracidiphilus sp.]|nr:hypothetical protein [Terracidiphilus sp.]